jgi:hypothetical protein
MPAGICTVRGKSLLVARLSPPNPRPGTSCVTAARWNASGSVPPDVPSTAASMGPAPSWLICLLLVSHPTSPHRATSKTTHLMKHHLNRPIIRTSRQPRVRPIARHGRDITLSRNLTGLPTTTTTPASTTTTKQPLQELPRHHHHTPTIALLPPPIPPTPPTPTPPSKTAQIILHPNRRIHGINARTGSAGAHEGRDHGGGVDGPVALGAAERADVARAHLAVADDGGVGLRAAAVGGAVAGGAVGDCGWGRGEWGVVGGILL